MNWEIIHHLRGTHSPHHIVGYECSSTDEEWHIFICANHEPKEYFEGWIPITVKDTHQEYYQCDRLGCEVGYWQEWVEEKNV